MKPVHFGILLTALMLIVSPAYSGPAEDGMQLYHQGDYATALPLLQPAAESGHIEAQYYLGYMYSRGLGVPISYPEALKWLRKAADQGHAGSALSLGFLIENGRGVDSDLDEAVRWYRIAAEGGNAQAQTNLGNAYNDGIGTEQSYKQAANWYEKAAENGHGGGATNLGFLYETGRGVSESAGEAVRYYRLGAERGDMIGMTNLGYMLANGLGVTQSHVQAAQWFRKAAELGHARGQYMLGQAYERGRGVAPSYDEALTWYRKAAAQDWKGAQDKIDALLQAGPNTFAQSVSATSRKPLITIKYSGSAKRLNETDCDALSRDISHVLSTPSADRPPGQIVSAKAIQWALRHEQMTVSGNGGCPNVDFNWPETADPTPKAESAQAERIAALPLSPEIRARFWQGALTELDKGNALLARTTASDRCFKYDLNVARSCFSAGWMGENGIGGGATLQLTRSYYKKACNLGDAFSCLIYQRYIYEGLGEGLDQNMDVYLASDYTGRLCNQGDANACDTYHVSVINTGYAVPSSRVSAAASYYRDRCSGTPRNYVSCYNLAILKEVPGYGMENAAEALALYDLSCKSGAMDQACKSARAIRVAKRRRDLDNMSASSSGGIGGFLSDLGRGINIASEMGAAQSAQTTTRSTPPRTAAGQATAQDWRDFDNAVRATNNIGTGFNSTCPASNPYC